ncbi:hypothetical protein ACTFIY_000992 [Dictyostelium cf. discoideum]
MKSHIDNDCNNSTIQCKYYEYGCQDEMKKSELQNHLNNVNHQFFMGLLIEKLSSSLTQSQNIQDELIKKIEQSEKVQEKFKYKNKWIISDYSKIVNIFPNGSKLKSPSFQMSSNNFLKSQSLFNVQSNEFLVYIYPNGHSDQKSQLSIFLNGN